MSTLISTVVLTWNRKHDLLKALASVGKQDYCEKQVVLIDSNSTDGTREDVLSRYPDIKYIHLPYNPGVIGGRNIGAANADGDLILFLDDDAEFLSRDAFSQIAQRFDAEPELAVMFFKYVLEDGRQWGWALPYNPALEFVNREIYTTTFVGCAYCVRRSWIDQIGYLNRDYFREGEEQEYSYRTLSKGGRILYFPEVEVLHRLNPHQRVYAEHQAYKLAHRSENDLTYLPWTDAVITVSWRLLANLIRATKEKWFLGYLRGCKMLLQALPRIIRRRKEKVFTKTTLHLLRTFRCYVIQNYEEATCMNTSLIDWIKVRITKQHLGVVKCRRD